MEYAIEPLYELEDNTEDERRRGQRAARSLAASVAKLHGAVPLPIAARRLTAAADGEDFRVPDIVRIIEADPALASGIMRQVRAALFGRVRCKSITQAVTLLGVKRIRSTALAAMASDLFSKNELPVAQELARLGRRCGSIARIFAPRADLASEEMYISGLLHDLGKLMMLRGDDPSYCGLLESTPPDRLHLAERERFGFDHALLAGHVLTAWKLAHPIPRIVGWHHQTARAHRAGGEIAKMIALVGLADRLALLPETVSAEEAAAAMAEMPDELAVLGFGDEVLPALAEELTHLPTDATVRTSSAPGASPPGTASGAPVRSPPATATGGGTTGASPIRGGPNASPAEPTRNVVVSGPPVVPTVIRIQETPTQTASGTHTTEPPKAAPKRRSIKPRAQGQPQLDGGQPAAFPGTIVASTPPTAVARSTGPPATLPVGSASVSPVASDSIRIAFKPEGAASSTLLPTPPLPSLTPPPAPTSLRPGVGPRAISTAFLASALFVAGAFFGRVTATRLPDDFEFAAWVGGLVATLWLWAAREYALNRTPEPTAPPAPPRTADTSLSKRAA